MKISRTDKIMGGVLLLAGAGYAAYKYWMAPLLTVYSLNPVDGSGVFRFGKTTGPITPGGVDGGWGWTLSFTSYVPGTGWTVQVLKNGTVGKTTVISSIGTTKVV